MYGIKSMRQTIKEIEVNVAYRWFLGLDFYDKVPHFSTFGKNYKRRLEGTDLFEQIFQEILLQCLKCDVINTDTCLLYTSAYALSAVPQIGVTGIWASVPIGWFLADAVGLICYRIRKKQHISR